jgi:hypothetical protein
VWLDEVHQAVLAYSLYVFLAQWAHNGEDATSSVRPHISSQANSMEESPYWQLIVTQSRSPVRFMEPVSVITIFTRALFWVSDYGLDDRDSRVRFPAGTGNFSLHHRVQNGSGTHPASYPVGTRGFFPGGKAAGAWSWPLPSSAEIKECVELYPHSPSTSSWRGA